MSYDIDDRDAVLVVDVQNDFCPGGSLAVEEGDAIVPVLNDLVAAAAKRKRPVVASRCWHPEHHVSFDERGGPWPVHCVQGSRGAELRSDLRLPDDTILVSKGMDLDRDQYSAFDGTGLADRLRGMGVERVWIGGLAQDVCVRATALDARREGFEVRLVRDATRAVDAADGDRALREIEEAGGVLV